MQYKIEGTPNSPVLIFSNSLGCTMKMWDELIPTLLPYFRILRYDTRGHGGSLSTGSGYKEELKIDDLGLDLIHLMDQLEIEKAYFCGLSMGGLIGQWLGINHPNRFYKIVLSNTAAKIGSSDTWNERINMLKEKGLEAIVEATMERWFTENFRKKNPQRVSETKNMFLKNDILGYSACCGAIREANFQENLHKLTVDTLVVTGNEDPVTNITQAEFLVSKIPKSQLKIINAKHLSSTEMPNEYAKMLIDFFVGSTTFEQGMHVRKTVLGAAYVNTANDDINEFNTDFQKFISNYAWGEIWTRPGLSKHNRSLITIAILIALNRGTELKMHIKAAFNNGVSKEEIKEIILQSGIYCGLPAANEAMHTAEQVFIEIG